MNWQSNKGKRRPLFGAAPPPAWHQSPHAFRPVAAPLCPLHCLAAIRFQSPPCLQPHSPRRARLPTAGEQQGPQQQRAAANHASICSTRTHSAAEPCPVSDAIMQLPGPSLAPSLAARADRCFHSTVAAPRSAAQAPPVCLLPPPAPTTLTGVLPGLVCRESRCCSLWPALLASEHPTPPSLPQL